MRSVFGPKGMILIWVILTATIGLGVQLKQVAVEIRTDHPEQLVAQLFETINSIPPKAIDTFFDAVHFVPGAVIFSLSGLPIQTIHVVILFGTILLALVLFLFRKALHSDTLADDLVMLVIMYLVFQIVIGIWARIDAGIGIVRPGFVCVLMVVTVIILAWRGGGKEDSRIFWKSLFEIYVILLFFFPKVIVDSTAVFFDGLAEFGSTLHSSAGFVFWSGVGLVVAAWLLYGAGSKKRRSTPEVIEDTRKKINEVLDKAKD